MEKLLEKLNSFIIFFILYSISFLIFFKTLKYSLPFVLAFIFSIILKKPTEFLIKKFNVKKSLASFLTTSTFFTIIIFILYFSITSLVKEGVDLAKNTQLYISNNYENIIDFFTNLEKYYYNLDPTISKTIENNLLAMLSKVSNYTVAVTSKLVQVTISLLSYIPYIFMLILFTLISTYFFTKDIASARNKLFSIIPTDKSDKIFNIFNESKKLLVNYAFSYLIIISITFIETLIGFLVLRVNYAVILSIIAATFDILPILGIGSVYIPLALINLFIKKNYFVALGVIIWYLIVTIVRQILEPKIVSSSLGMHPVSILAAIFVGLKAGGFSGMFFCIFLVVFYKVLRNVKIL